MSSLSRRAKQDVQHMQTHERQQGSGMIFWVLHWYNVSVYAQRSRIKHCNTSATGPVLDVTLMKHSRSEQRSRTFFSSATQEGMSASETTVMQIGSY